MRGKQANTKCPLPDAPALKGMGLGGGPWGLWEDTWAMGKREARW